MGVIFIRQSKRRHKTETKQYHATKNLMEISLCILYIERILLRVLSFNFESTNVIR